MARRTVLTSRQLAPGELVPRPVVDFIARQLDLDGDDLADYAARIETRHDHLAELHRLYGFRSFSGGAARAIRNRLRSEAELACSNEDLVRRFVNECRRTHTILPATTTIERSQNWLYCSPSGCSALYSCHSSARVTPLRRRSAWTWAQFGVTRSTRGETCATGNSRASSARSQGMHDD